MAVPNLKLLLLKPYNATTLQWIGTLIAGYNFGTENKRHENQSRLRNWVGKFLSGGKNKNVILTLVDRR